MALQKTIALPSGVSANYFRIVGFRWDRNAREASALFALFLNAATAVAGRPLVPIAVKLRLNDAGFDAYLSPAALAASEQDVVAQLYAAAREACEAYAADETSELGACIACDFGKGVFADAVDV